MIFWAICLHFEIENAVSFKISIKVEKILQGSLDSILSPSPSVKIQIMGGKICLRCRGKTMLGICFQKFVDNAQQCFAFTPSKLSRP